MISADTERTLDQLLQNQNSYTPNAAIAELLADKSIVMLVGATCEGKTTTMHTAVELDSRFGTTGNFTSRAPRDDDIDSYAYYEHSDAGLAPILARIKRHEVVQYAVNPFTKQIYGTELNDYRSEYNIKDVFAGAIEQFRQLGFGRTIAVTVVSEPAAWLRRFEERFPVGDDRRQARRDEAILSFEWSLEQPDDEHFWVENIEGDSSHAAQEVIALTIDESSAQNQGRQLCQASLTAARNITV
jgi:guanylate kinase